jgi:hypothetical protein
MIPPMLVRTTTPHRRCSTATADEESSRAFVHLSARREIQSAVRRQSMRDRLLRFVA